MPLPVWRGCEKPTCCESGDAGIWWASVQVAGGAADRARLASKRGVGPEGRRNQEARHPVNPAEAVLAGAPPRLVPLPSGEGWWDLADRPDPAHQHRPQEQEDDREREDTR